MVNNWIKKERLLSSQMKMFLQCHRKNDGFRVIQLKPQEKNIRTQATVDHIIQQLIELEADSKTFSLALAVVW